MIFHGFNDECRYTEIITDIQSMVKLNDSYVNKIYAECLEINPASPAHTSIFMEMKKQAEAYCTLVQNHPVFNSTDFNIIGLSQGNLVARYIIEHCDLGKYKVHNYLSLGGPHQGVQKQPKCFSGIWCNILNYVE